MANTINNSRKNISFLSSKVFGKNEILPNPTFRLNSQSLLDPGFTFRRIFGRKGDRGFEDVDLMCRQRLVLLEDSRDVGDTGGV